MYVELLASLATWPPMAPQGQKRKFKKEAGGDDTSFNIEKRIVTAKLRSVFGFEMLDFSDISEHTQQSIHGGWCLEMRDMKAWTLRTSGLGY